MQNVCWRKTPHFRLMKTIYSGLNLQTGYPKQRGDRIRRPNGCRLLAVRLLSSISRALVCVLVATSLAFLKDCTPTEGIGAENPWEFPHFRISSRHTLTPRTDLNGPHLTAWRIMRPADKGFGLQIQWKPLIMITLGPALFDNNNRLITLSGVNS